MALLKKIRSATLMETLVATVLIVIIFTVASLLLNSVFSNSIKGNTQPIKDKLQQLSYQYNNDLITLPYTEEWNTYEIIVRKETFDQMGFVVLEATDTKWNKRIISYVKDK